MSGISNTIMPIIRKLLINYNARTSIKREYAQLLGQIESQYCGILIKMWLDLKNIFFYSLEITNEVYTSALSQNK